MSDASNSSALIKEAFDNAVAHHQAGRLQQAEELYRAILQLNAHHPDANHNLGIIAVQLKQVAASLPFFKAALAANPGEPRFWHSYIEALSAAGETAAASEVLQLSRKHGIAPRDAPSSAQARTSGRSSHPAPSPDATKPGQHELQALAAAFRKQDYAQMESLALALAEKYPYAIDGWKALSLVYFHTERYEQALPATLRMVELRPDEAQSHADLGLILWRLRRLAEAEAEFRLALSIDPDVSDTHTNLGNVHKDQERLVEAMQCYRRAIELDPKQAVPYSNLGVLLTLHQEFREAERCFRTALQLDPDNAFALRNLSTALTKLGQLGEAESVIRRAIEREPDNTLAYDLLLFLFNYRHTGKAREARELAERYGQLVARRRCRRYDSWGCEDKPFRLKVGIVSADLHGHPVGYFVESLVGNLSSDRVELIAYVHMSEQKYDALTDRIRPHFSAWKSIYRLSDQDAAALIHADGVHVLLDLSGHTTDNRLPMFAYKPAPVQASWLGYFATTGVAEMDYLVGDPWLCPPEEEAHFTETVWRLPQTWLAFTPPQSDIAVAELPALAQGHVTFGCFNNLNKVNDAVVALWADLLQRLPDSRLFLKAPQLHDVEVQAQTFARFAALGIAADRLILEGHSPRQEYLEAYSRVDIALDPFPYPGGATSVDTLWMGVPVLTLRGSRFLAHLGESVAMNAGLGDWIADDKADYIAKALAFAADLPALATLRKGMRARLIESPLLDTTGFARGFEDALWLMWEKRGKASSSPTTAAGQPKSIPAGQADKLQRLMQQRKYAEAEKQALDIVQNHPHSELAWRTLSRAQYNQGRLENAMQSTQKLLQLQPDDAAAHGMLGLILIGQKRMPEAAHSLARAIELDPAKTDAYINLAYVHRYSARLDDAAECYRQAIAINPSLADAHANLGVILLEQQQLRAAESSFRAALRLSSDHAAALLGLGSTLVKLGVLEEAESLMRRLIKREPDNAQAYDILLFLLNYRNPGYSEEAMQLARRYGKMASRKAAKPYTQWSCAAAPARLRVGIVSGDLYNHPVGYFLEGLLKELDPSRMEVVAYSNRPEHRGDAMSTRLQSYCSEWKDIHGLDDAAAAALIHADGVHVLLDLAGHTGNTRLPIFAWKPAPVQAAWLGYFATTGVEQMDYVIADPNVCPPGEEAHFTETVWRLPESYLCFTPPDVHVDIAPLPALSNRYITFGCFNNVGKLTDAVVATWSRILGQVPGSRLMLKARQLGDDAMRAWIIGKFKARGIGEERLILEGPTVRKDYLQAYQRLDIVLDPFPYPGGTTTMEALWMGVPVLTLRGNRMLSHAGENIMHNVGLPQWIAASEDEYVAKAVAFAGDLDALAALHGRLRDQALASPMFDAPRFARFFEEAVWGMWKTRQKPAD